MGLDELKPGNTKRAQATAIKAFKTFVKAENVDFDYVKRCIEKDDTGKCLVSILDKFVATQVAPSVALIDNLPELPVEAAVTLSPAMLLLEVLNHPADFTALEDSAAQAAVASTAQASAAPASAAAVPTIYTHVNRLLDRVAHPAGVTDALTSHSFRRRGAQHVNGCDGLTQRWIFDRGAWNMSTTNKGFNYIFNTSREDHKVSKALSGYDTQTEVKALDLKPFDAETRSKITGFQRLLFTACYKMENAAYNLSQHVLDVLTAYLILHYPRMKKLQDGGLVVRMEASAAGAGASVAELLAWSSHLASCQSIDLRKNKEQASTIIADRSNQNKIIDHQRSMIDQLMEHIKRQDERLGNLETKMDGTALQSTSKKRQHEPGEDQDKRKRRRGSATYLHCVWFAWYAQEPRTWQSAISKQQKSDAKLLVAFMKLFLSDGFVLDTSRGAGAVLKHLRILHRSGVLIAKIERHQRLLQTTAIRDPAPGHTQNILEPVV
ncbi:hypothetical protein AM588_10001869 [Phytophthora nicotianae]|uniref:Uncharacterized protein n=1 Tax=Phytophthora nicotianae TaxID=4792 RepID=A0A0W8CWZ5_PHYNI|nr:hypothetical protein AM588_10001869 [Phytophthora nicotianae]